jgi:ribosome-binding protein aMBF1 (putative translation factor)
VIKRSFPSDSVQRCELCELVFPAKDAGDWLRYYRSPPLPGPESA